MEVRICMTINQKWWLSPTMFEQLSRYAEFKADFHHVYIQAQKDLEKKWFDLPYLDNDDTISKVIKSWPTEWNSTSNVAARTRNSVEKKKKEAAR